MALRSIIRDNANAKLAQLGHLSLPLSLGSDARLKTRSLNELASSSYRLLTILPTHHQDWAVSISYHRIRDVAHEGSPYPAQSSAPYHYKLSTYFFAQRDDLFVGPFQP